ncbi:unnamed protein product, partial [Symbiodinium necroappetens]
AADGTGLEQFDFSSTQSRDICPLPCLEELQVPSKVRSLLGWSATLSARVFGGILLCDYENWLLQDAGAWAELAESAAKVRPYNDPNLHNRESYVAFLKHFCACGVPSQTSCCRGRVGAFTVAKKPKVVDGKKQERQRLVLDCRQVNLQFRQPPLTELGSLAALTELELGRGDKLFTAGSDIRDCFYACNMPAGMEQFFCLMSDLSVEECCEIFGGSTVDYNSLDRQRSLGDAVLRQRALSFHQQGGYGFSLHEDEAASVEFKSGMAIFRKLYDFVQAGSEPRRPKRAEAEECEIFIGLVPLLVGDIRKEWSETVTVTDASPMGYGVCESRLPYSEVQQMGRWNERWRFRRLPPEEWKPRQRATGLSPIFDLCTAGAGYEFNEFDQFEPNQDFPEIPHKVCKASRWRTVMMGKWSETSEHITLKEGRALVLACRRICRNVCSRGRKHLMLVDNLSLAFIASKGRASNFAQLRVQQQISALSLAGDVFFRLRWLPSEGNAADGPSRGQIEPGSFMPRCPPACAESIVKDFDGTSWGGEEGLRSSQGGSRPEVGLRAEPPCESSEGARSRFLQEDLSKVKKTTLKKGITYLESKSISEEITVAYEKYCSNFKSFCKAQGQKGIGPRIDDLLAEYLDELFMDGKGLSEAEKTVAVAAVEFFNLGVKGHLLRSKRALKGLTQLVEGRSDFFAELAKSVGYEVQRLLRFTLLGYTNPLTAELEQKAQQQVSEGLRTVLSHLSTYVDEVFTASKTSQEVPSQDFGGLQRQLDASISQGQELQEVLAKSDRKLLKSTQLQNKLRSMYHQDLEAQRARFRYLLSRYLEYFTPEDLEMVHDLMNVRFFNPDSALDEDTEQLLQRKAAALQESFNAQKEGLVLQLAALSREETAMRQKLALEQKKVRLLQARVGEDVDVDDLEEAPKDTATHEEDSAGRSHMAFIKITALEDALQQQASWLQDLDRKDKSDALQRFQAPHVRRALLELCFSCDAVLLRLCLEKAAAAKAALDGARVVSEELLESSLERQRADLAENFAKIEESKKEVAEKELETMTQELARLRSEVEKAKKERLAVSAGGEEEEGQLELTRELSRTKELLQQKSRSLQEKSQSLRKMAKKVERLQALQKKDGKNSGQTKSEGEGVPSETSPREGESSEEEPAEPANAEDGDGQEWGNPDGDPSENSASASPAPSADSAESEREGREGSGSSSPARPGEAAAMHGQGSASEAAAEEAAPSEASEAVPKPREVLPASEGSCEAADSAPKQSAGPGSEEGRAAEASSAEPKAETETEAEAEAAEAAAQNAHPEALAATASPQASKSPRRAVSAGEMRESAGQLERAEESCLLAQECRPARISGPLAQEKPRRRRRRGAAPAEPAEQAAQAAARAGSDGQLAELANLGELGERPEGLKAQ